MTVPSGLSLMRSEEPESTFGRVDAYQQFMNSRLQDGSREGFKPNFLPSCLFDFQGSTVEWNIWKGKSSTLLDCGMGKSLIELVWAENVTRHVNRPVLILTPLAVAQQFVTEAEKFGIEVHRTAKKVYPGINITNYEKLHHFDANDFAAVVCDEASCLKAFDGKRRAQVTEFLRTLKYRLMATATAAPNDYIELGTLSEALGVMGQVDMLNRFFKNEQNTVDMKGGKSRYGSEKSAAYVQPQWRFKGHAELPFWRWVCGWARAGRKPSDLGNFSDERFKLPPLIEREHIVETRSLADGYLFPMAATNRQEELEERRRTKQERCEMAAELVAHTGKPFIIWCQLNPEGDLLEKLLPDAVQISGADDDDEKEEKYAAFLTGQKRGMVSKQRIGGWGLNCQHCSHVVEFASHSFESHYQGVRRCWRFGQTQPVVNDIVSTEGQRGAMENMRRKAHACDKMFDALVEHMAEAQHIDAGYKFDKQVEVPKW